MLKGGFWGRRDFQYCSLNYRELPASAALVQAAQWQIIVECSLEYASFTSLYHTPLMFVE